MRPGGGWLRLKSRFALRRFTPILPTSPGSRAAAADDDDDDEPPLPPCASMSRSPYRYPAGAAWKAAARVGYPQAWPGPCLCDHTMWDPDTHWTLT